MTQKHHKRILKKNQFFFQNRDWTVKTNSSLMLLIMTSFVILNLLHIYIMFVYQKIISFKSDF